MEDKRKYIALLRVSTKIQKHSGLGLESQKYAIENFITRNGGEIIEMITEVESGGNKDTISIDNNLNIEKLLRKRPKLLYAVRLAQKENACILVKEASRLSRYSLLIDFLLSAGVQFLCVDAPNDSPMIIKLKTSINEEELLKISMRTRHALKAKKAQGFILGTPANLTRAAIMKSVEVRQAAALQNANYKMIGYILMCRDKGAMTFQAIADRLNLENHKTTNGKRFSAKTVYWLYSKGRNSSV